jgi:hypothetical protein
MRFPLMTHGTEGFHDSSTSASSLQTSCLSSTWRSNHPGDSDAPADGDPRVNELPEGARGRRVELPETLAGPTLRAFQT